MRRSAAPSQLLGNSAKKPRFIPPGKMNTVFLKKELEHVDLERETAEVILGEKKPRHVYTSVNYAQYSGSYSHVRMGDITALKSCPDSVV